MNIMNCERAVRILTNLDSPTYDSELVRRARDHVLHCPQCASQTDEVKNAGDETIQKIPSVLRQHRGMTSARLALWLLGLAQFLVALPWVFGSTFLWDPSTTAAESHLTRDGIIGVLFALTAITVAASPRLAYFAIPACGVLLVLQIITLIVDQQTDLVHVQFESIHLLAVAITIHVLVVFSLPKWLFRRLGRASSQSRNTKEKKSLRSVR
jgi:hypothetical protein